jgi:hypothetical protein
MGSLLPRPRRAACRARLPLLLTGRIGIQREDERVDMPCPRATPALHAKDGHHAGDTLGQQRERITGAFADLERPRSGVQRGGGYVWSMQELF